jgi:serine/threonine protein kinase
MATFPQVEGYKIVKNIGRGSTSTVYLAHAKVCTCIFIQIYSYVGCTLKIRETISTYYNFNYSFLVVGAYNLESHERPLFIIVISII